MAEKLEFLFNTFGLIEATSFERHCLWEQWHDRADGPRLKWVENLVGKICRIGSVGHHDVYLSLFSAMIEGKKIVFYEATSRVVDHDLVQKFLRENVESDCRRTDANNAHIVLNETRK